MPIIERIKQKVNIYGIVEGCFLAVCGCYLLFLLQSTTTYHFELSPTLEHDLLSTLIVITPLKCLASLWQKRESSKKWIVLFTLSWLVCWAYLLVYWTDGYPFLEFLGIMTVGMVGSDYHKVLRLFVCVSAAFLSSVVIASLLGVIQNYVYLVGGDIRSAWGVAYPTDYASYVFYLCVLAWIAWKRVPNVVFALVGALSFANAYYIAHSRTSMICSVLLVLVIIAYEVFCLLSKERLKLTGRVTRIGSKIISLAFPLFAMLVLGLMWLYPKGFTLAYIFDDVFSGRLRLAYDAYAEHGVSLFGTPFDQIGAGGTTFTRSGYNFVDSTYPLMLLRYGVVLLLVVAVIWTLMAKKAIKLGDWRLALGMALIAFHSMSEHHFIEVNYNVLLVLPFAVLGMEAEAAHCVRKQPLPQRRRACATAMVLLIVAAFLFVAGPWFLSLARTAWDVTAFGDSKEALVQKMPLVCTALMAGAVLAVLAVRALYRMALFICHRSSSRRQVPLRDVLALAAFVIYAISMVVFCNAALNRHAQQFDAVVQVDRQAIEAVQAARQESGGRMYSNEVPELFQQAYGGFSSSAFQGDDLARFTNITVLADANDESDCFTGKGFLYTQISHEHALYTNDEAAIQSLTNAGYHLTGYYSKERELDLQELAIQNELQMIEDGAMWLRGSAHSLARGPYMELRAGTYTVTYDLAVPEDGYDPNTDDDYELGCLLLKWDVGKHIVKEERLYRSQFGVDGVYSAQVVGTFPECRGVEFHVLMNGDYELFVHRIAYQKTPEYDTHSFFDAKGRKERDEYYDLEGNPYVLKDGYCAIEFGYDAADNNSIRRYLDANHQPVALSQGYAEIKRTYNVKRQIVREDFFDADGNPVIRSDGYASVEYEYDTAGNESACQYFDDAGKPVMLSKHYAAVRKTFDSEGRVVRIEYYDASNNPVRMSLGYAVVDHEYDQNDNETAICFYDENNQPVQSTAGYAQMRRAFEGKRLMEESYHDENGELKAIKGDYACVRYEYDLYGNQTEIRYYNADDKPVMAYDSYARIHRTYDENGRVDCETYYDITDTPVVREEGYVVYKREYDDEGNVTAQVYEDASGNPVMRTDGYAIIKNTYNDKRQVIREQYFDEHGKVCSQINGAASVEYTYDAAGNRAGIRYCDAQGNLMSTVAGYAEIRREFNDYKKVTKESYFGVDGNLINQSRGYAVTVYDYDENWNIIRVTHYTAEGDVVR